MRFLATRVGEPIVYAANGCKLYRGHAGSRIKNAFLNIHFRKVFQLCRPCHTGHSSGWKQCARIASGYFIAKTVELMQQMLSVG